MQVHRAFLFCLISILPLSVFAAPNFTVRQDGRSLFVYLKDKTFVDQVISKMKSVRPHTEAIVVYNHEDHTTFVQFYEYFEDEAPQAEVVTRLEDMLEGLTKTSERFIPTNPRVPYIPTQDEFELRRAAHIERVVHMTRNPEEYTRADIAATIQEHADLAIMPIQREAVLGRLGPSAAVAREQIDAMVRDLNQLQIERDRFIRERPAISVLQMLEALGCQYVNFN